MIEVKYSKEAYNRIINIINTLVEKINDMTPIWDDFAVFYPKEIVEKAFDSRGKEFGSKWANYSDKYREWRKKKGYSGDQQMLVLSGAMKKIALNPECQKSRMNMKMIVNNSLASIHQFGAKLKHGKIPARPFFAMPDKTIPKRAVLWLMKTMRNYIKYGKAPSGAGTISKA